MKEEGNFPIAYLNGEPYFFAENGAIISTSTVKEVFRLNSNVNNIRDLVEMVTVQREGSKPRGWKRRLRAE
ncbi:hypothetical protein KAI54_00450 [Candidatus Gracilibacteria bacterium]|nr:hypothetical protein [Candidatus Gracilibacteria bacterium]